MRRVNQSGRLRTSANREISDAGRAAMSAAGRKNAPAMLAANKARRQDTGAIAAQVDELVARMKSELGSNLSARQECLLISQRSLLLTVLSANDYLSRAGAVASHGRVRPVLAVLVTYTNGLRLNCEALGLSDSSSGNTSDGDVDAVIEEIKAARETNREAS
jgi:hypothetical protein